MRRGPSPSQAPVQRPNIMMIHCHDLGRHLGCYGWDVETPNVDHMAEEGVIFTNHFSTAPNCTPSRCSRVTGLYPTRHGLGHIDFGWALPPDAKTLPVCLNEAGYDTCLFGLQGEALHPDRLGYKHCEHGYPSAPSHAPDVTQRVLEFLDGVDGSGQPFYADVGFMEVHRHGPAGGWEAWRDPKPPRTFNLRYIHKSEDSSRYIGQMVVPVENPPGPYARRYSPEEVRPLPYLPDRPGVRQDLADLCEVITNVVDVSVGQILDKLRQRGLDENTVVIFTTDHGLDMPLAKGSLYDSGIGISLIMRYPKRFVAGARHDDFVSNVDLLPTLVELAGGRPPEDIDGRSFLPLLLGGRYESRTSLYAEIDWHGWYFGLRGIRTPRFKYLRNLFPNPGAYQICSIWTRAGIDMIGHALSGQRPLEELYDLEVDPHEQHNLAPPRLMHDLLGRRRGWGTQGDPAYADVVTSLSDQLRQHMEEVNDRLLAGPVPHVAQHLAWERGTIPPEDRRQKGKR